MFAEKFAGKSNDELVAEAIRHARSMSEVITEASRRGVELNVELERVPIKGQDSLFQVMVYVVNA